MNIYPVSRPAEAKTGLRRHPFLYLLASIALIAGIVYGLNASGLLKKNGATDNTNGQVAGATYDNYQMAKLGTDALGNAEAYPAADGTGGSGGTATTSPTASNGTPAAQGMQPLATTAPSGAAQDPARTETFTKSYYGFSLTGNTSADLSGLSFKIVKADGSTSAAYAVNPAGDQVDRDGNPITKDFSDEYLFQEGVTAVKFYYTGTKNFTVNKIDFTDTALKANGATGGLTSQSLTPASDTPTLSQASADFKNKFMAAAGLNIVTRDEYGAPADSTFAPGWTPPYYAVNRIVIHHTATGVDMNNPANTVAAIWRDHTYNRDWGDIGYNYLIDPYGTIYEGRAGSNGVRGNHAPPNEGTIGISMLGDYTSQVPTQASLDSLAKLIAYLGTVNNIPFNYYNYYNENSPQPGIYPHFAFNDYVKAHYQANDEWRSLVTSCPGAAFANILPQVVSAAAGFAGSNTALKDLLAQYQTLYRPEKMVVTGGNNQILIPEDKLTTTLKTYLTAPGHKFNGSSEVGGMLVLNIAKSLTQQFITEINLTAPVVKAQANYMYTPVGWTTDNATGIPRSFPDDYNSLYWNLNKIKAPEAWASMGGCTSDGSCQGSQSVIVAVLDTGIAYENYPFNDTANYDLSRGYTQDPELSNVHFITPGYDAYQASDCQSRTGDNLCNAVESEKVHHANDDLGHGTAVASVIAANTGDSGLNGIIGIASNISILPVKVYYPNQGPDGSYCRNQYDKYIGDCASTTDLILGIQFAVANHAKVINMSLGGTDYDADLETAINEAAAAGVVMVAASGNNKGGSDPTSVFYPAAYSNVIAAGATDINDQRASYSNYGPQLDIMAPVGNGIPVSTLKCWTATGSNGITPCYLTNDNYEYTNTYGTLTTGSGTSFAAPQVAAEAALLLSYKPALTNDQVRSLIISSASDLGVTGWDQDTGFGLIDLNQALLLSGSTQFPTINDISPTSGKARGGDIVTVNGSNFMDGATVTLKGISATDVNFISSSQLTFKTPMVAAGGPADLVITNPNQLVALQSGIFTYAPTTQNLLVSAGFRSGADNWSTAQTKSMIKGDFNGDGKSDLAFVYDYGNNDMGVWVMLSNGNGYNNPSLWYRTGQGNWDVNRTKGVINGDYNNDGKDDIALVYDYGNNDMGIWVMLSSGSSISGTRLWYHTGAGNWNVAQTKGFLGGDFNGDHLGDVGLVYDYGNNNMGIWVMSSNGSGFSNANLWFRSGAGNWNVAQTKGYLSGDYNHDGFSDFGFVYDYGNNDMGIWVMLSDGNRIASTQRWYHTGAGNWNVNQTKGYMSGDFNGDGFTDIALAYDYGNYDMGIWIMPSNGSAISQPALWFRSGSGNWNVNQTKFWSSGDLNNDQLAEISAAYDYEHNDMGIWMFK